MARKSVAALLEALKSEPAPCCGCKFRIKCGTHNLACEVFSDYVKFGPRAKYSEHRVPGRQIMLEIYRKR